MLKLTGETLIERWILHKLNLAADEVNKQLTARKFMASTAPVYRFWSYELCDVYIVSFPYALSRVSG
jgi:valyl-tRNA synthetase